ncbi:MAG: rRNA maturation RNase YbeY [Planctomycetes bacterium]|nr:rRNA maturation RNase YbeY [Planctomycetota bacterium]
MTSAVEVTDRTGAGADVDAAWVAGLVRGVLRAEAAATSVHVVLVDDAEIRRLNRRFHHTDAPTDVLAFVLSRGAEEEAAWDPAGEGPGAEVVVSVETARREADARGLELRAELALYVVHGVLHVLGHADCDARSRSRMRAAEARHLEAVGLSGALFAARRRRPRRAGREENQGPK